ncbi:MAG: hypothetical protein KAH32_01845, partial [Chlamydiia bacterium]|nr:hypothetical protein [Chlamydiia bacterium]
CGEQICGGGEEDDDFKKYERCMKRCFGDCIRAVNTDYPSLRKCIDVDNLDRPGETRLNEKWAAWLSITKDYFDTLEEIKDVTEIAIIIGLIETVIAAKAVGVWGLVAGLAVAALGILLVRNATFNRMLKRNKDTIISAGLMIGKDVRESLEMNLKLEGRCREYCRRYRPAEWRKAPTS